MAPLASPGLGMGSPGGIGTVIGDDGDEVISTAVVVKNIPFSLKKETLLDLFVRASTFDARGSMLTMAGSDVLAEALCVQLSL